MSLALVPLQGRQKQGNKERDMVGMIYEEKDWQLEYIDFVQNTWIGIEKLRWGLRQR